MLPVNFLPWQQHNYQLLKTLLYRDIAINLLIIMILLTSHRIMIFINGKPFEQYQKTLINLEKQIIKLKSYNKEFNSNNRMAELSFVTKVEHLNQEKIEIINKVVTSLPNTIWLFSVTEDNHIYFDGYSYSPDFIVYFLRDLESELSTELIKINREDSYYFFSFMVKRNDFNESQRL